MEDNSKFRTFQYKKINFKIKLIQKSLRLCPPFLLLFLDPFPFWLLLLPVASPSAQGYSPNLFTCLFSILHDFSFVLIIVLGSDFICCLSNEFPPFSLK